MGVDAHFTAQPVPLRVRRTQLSVRDGSQEDGQAPAELLCWARSQASPGSVCQFPHTAGQSLSLSARALTGQQPSPGMGSDDGPVSSMAQVPADTSSSRVQGLRSSQSPSPGQDVGVPATAPVSQLGRLACAVAAGGGAVAVGGGGGAFRAAPIAGQHLFDGDVLAGELAVGADGAVLGAGHAVVAGCRRAGAGEPARDSRITQLVVVEANRRHVGSPSRGGMGVSAPTSGRPASVSGRQATRQLSVSSTFVRCPGRDHHLLDAGPGQHLAIGVEGRHLEAQGAGHVAPELKRKVGREADLASAGFGKSCIRRTPALSTTTFNTRTAPLGRASGNNTRTTSAVPPPRPVIVFLQPNASTQVRHASSTADRDGRGGGRRGARS